MMKNGVLVLVAVLLTSCTVNAARPLPPVEEGSRATGESLSERVARLEKRLSSETLLEMLQRLEQLQNEVQQLRGQVEEMAHSLEGIKKRQRDIYLDLDQRIQQLAGGEAPPGAAIAPPIGVPEVPEPEQPPPQEAPGQAPEGGPAPQPVPEQANNVDPAQAQAAYQKAFDVLKEGHYSAAIEAFNQYLTQYPNSPYVDNAHYWLAEAHYVRREFIEAREGFNKVVENFPESPKAPDALLKMGFVEYEMANWSKARELLNEVIARFPDSSAARLAEKRLEQMRQAGR